MRRLICLALALVALLPVPALANIWSGQVSIGTSSTLLVAARPGRREVTIVVNGANACAFGRSGVTASTGILLPGTAGVSISIKSSAAIYGACASATTVSYLEQY